jgi:hypothetical protein
VTYLWYEGIAIAARMPTTITTIISSMSVTPAARFNILWPPEFLRPFMRNPRS